MNGLWRPGGAAAGERRRQRRSAAGPSRLRLRRRAALGRSAALLLLAGSAAGVTQLRVEEAARGGARAVARGAAAGEVGEIVRRLAGDTADSEVTHDGEWHRVLRFRRVARRGVQARSGWAGLSSEVPAEAAVVPGLPACMRSPASWSSTSISVTAASLSSGLFLLPHLGDWTQEGQPDSHSQALMASRVAVSQQPGLVVAALGGEAGPAGAAVVDNDGGHSGVGVDGRGHSADVPAVARGHQRKEASMACVLGGMQRALGLRCLDEPRAGQRAVVHNKPDRLGKQVPGAHPTGSSPRISFEIDALRWKETTWVVTFISPKCTATSPHWVVRCVSRTSIWVTSRAVV